MRPIIDESQVPYLVNGYSNMARRETPAGRALAKRLRESGVIEVTRDTLADVLAIVHDMPEVLAEIEEMDAETAQQVFPII